MEPQGRGSNPALSERVRRESRRFEFAQLAVLLRRLHGAGASGRFRYRGDFSMRHPTSEAEVRSMPRSDPDRPGEVRVSFLGLAGVMGALPAHYAELMDQRRRAGAPVARRTRDASPGGGRTHRGRAGSMEDRRRSDRSSRRLMR